MSAFFHPNQALDNVTESKVVMAEARQLLDFFMRKNFINEFGESSMHIMKVGFWSLLKSSFQECLFPFGVAYALQKDSPYTKRCPLTFAINTISQGSAARFSS